MIKLLTSLFLISFVGLLVYTQDMKQLNPESLFLTDSGVDKYSDFQKRFPEKQVLIVTQTVTDTNKETYLEPG